MAVSHLTSGASLPLPNGPLQLRLEGGSDVELVLLGANDEEVTPDHRQRPGEVLVVPRGVDVVVAARKTAGGRFAGGQMVGLTVNHPAFPQDAVTKPALDAGGRIVMQLARITGVGDAVQIHDIGGPSRTPLTSRPWHKLGGYAYHADHAGTGARDMPWAMVIDTSASALALPKRDGYGRLISGVFGILAAASPQVPAAVLAAGRREGEDDLWPGLDTDSPQWLEALGSVPAPWSRVTASVQRAAQAVGREGVVCLVVDGVPVDGAALRRFAEDDSNPSLLVVCVATSRFDVTPAERPTEIWKEELEALSGLSAGGRHRLAAVRRPDLDEDATRRLANSLFPVGVR